MTDPIAEQSIRELSEELEQAKADRQALVEQGAHYKREYEAALARAEAAEETLELRRADFALESKTRVAAESRLAEATALLKETIEGGGTQPEATDERIRAFLSGSTPASAAWDIRGREPVLVPAQAAEPAAERDPYKQGYVDGSEATARELLGYQERDERLAKSVDALREYLERPEQPDTIALRECRAELEHAHLTNLQVLKDLQSTRADLATARARITELEALAEARLGDLDRLVTSYNRMDTRTARARAALTSARTVNLKARIDRALELLR